MQKFGPAPKGYRPMHKFVPHPKGYRPMHKFCPAPYNPYAAKESGRSLTEVNVRAPTDPGRACARARADSATGEAMSW